MFKWMCVLLFMACSTLSAADSLWVAVDTVNNPGLAVQFFIEPPLWKTEKLPTGEYIEIEGKQFPIIGKEVSVLTGRCIQVDSLGKQHIINARMQGHPERMQIVAVTDTLPLIEGPDGKFEDISCRIWLSSDGKKLKLEPDSSVKR